ncbi:MAG: hypothetical protein HKM07_06635 [Chlamydiae bacterium]|nr:hypothetical protein [Chlamydiota bacterium]
MALPANFSGAPGEELHRYFRNVCNEFKKTIKSSKELEKLNWEMERFIDISKQMNWHQKTSAVFHKDEGAKSTTKVISEFQRYAEDLKTQQKNANPHDLLEALGEVERLIQNLKAT